MTHRDEVRERLAELEQEVAALRRRLESTPPRNHADGEAGEAGKGEPAAADLAGSDPAAGDPAAADGEPGSEPRVAGIRSSAGGADEHVR